MVKMVESNIASYTADEAIAQYLRVKLDADGKVTKATASSSWHGTAAEQILAAGDPCPVRLRTGSGTHIMIASEAITLGNPVFAAAAGKVAADGDFVCGIACNAASADGDQIEVLAVSGGSGGGGGGYLTAAQQALSGAGAVNVTSFYTAWTTTGADAGTLADGTFAGQLKKIQLIVDGGDGTLTPTNLNGGTTITFADAGDYALLVWDGDTWNAIELGNDADGATAPVLA